MKNMTELAERFTAIGKAWTELLNACEAGDTETATNCQDYIIGYLAGLMKDGILTYEDNKRLCEEIQEHISDI
jgi:hypothetical protein